MKPIKTSSQTVKSNRLCKQAMTSWRQTISKEKWEIEPVASGGQGFVWPVPVAMTTVRLVREAEIQLRRPRLHLIPLELRRLSPRPITLVSLQGRLPNLHRLCSPAIQWLLDAQNATPNRLEDSQSSSVTSLQITRTEKLQWCQTLFGLWVVCDLSSQWFSLKRLRRWVALKRQKLYLTLSSHHFMV